MIRLEDGVLNFLINGVPQQRGSVVVIIPGEDFVGLRYLGSARQLVAPVHFSEWENGAAVPYPTRQALFDDLAAFAFESNASGIPDAPVDGLSYVRNSAGWLQLRPEIKAFLNYTNTVLPAPFSTTSAVYVFVFGHTFVAEPAEYWRLDLVFDYFIASSSQRMQFDIRLNGVSIYEILKEAKDNDEVSLINAFASAGATTPLALLSGNNLLELYARKDNGTAAVEINSGGFVTMRVNLP